MRNFNTLIRRFQERRGDNVTAGSIREVIYSSNASVRKKFKLAFAPEIKIFVKEAFRAYEAYKVVDDQCVGDKRKSYVAGFLFGAFIE